MFTTEKGDLHGIAKKKKKTLKNRKKIDRPSSHDSWCRLDQKTISPTVAPHAKGVQFPIHIALNYRREPKFPHGFHAGVL